MTAYTVLITIPTHLNIKASSEKEAKESAEVKLKNLTGATLDELVYHSERMEITSIFEEEE